MEKTNTNLLGSEEKAWCNWKNWKAVLMGFVGLSIAFFIMGLSFLAIAAPEDVNVTATEIKKVDYYLPYPGILPDSPLYKIKALRDRIKLLITFDETEKARLELQYADKRINAAFALSEGNKRNLAMTTATKAEKYLEQSTNRVIKLIKMGRDEKSLLLSLDKAIMKHLEMLLEIKAKDGNENDKAMEDTIKMNQILSEQVGQVLIEEK